jgi:hypothetical protein
MFIKAVKIGRLEYGVETISTGEASVTCLGLTTWFENLEAAEKSLSVIQKANA